MSTRSAEPRGMRYLRALGWAALAAGPIFLSALAVAAANPLASQTIVGSSAWAAWIAGALAFAASLLRQRGARMASVATGAGATLVVVACLAFMVFISDRAPLAIELQESDRRELIPTDVEGAAFLSHPELGFAIPAPGQDLGVSTHIVDATRAAGGDAFFRTHHVWAWEGSGTELVVELSRVRERSRAAIVRSAAEVAPNLSDDALVVEGFSARIDRALGNGGLHLSRIELVDTDRGPYRLVLTVVTRPEQRGRWVRWLEQVRTTEAPLQ